MKKTLYCLVMGLMFLTSFLVAGTTVNKDGPVTTGNSNDWVPELMNINIYCDTPESKQINCLIRHQDQLDQLMLFVHIFMS